MNPAGSAFLAELKQLRERCGSPSYRALATASRNDLPTLYPDRCLPALSPTAIHEILAGRRVDLPNAAWVASFVLCCQRLGWQIGNFATDPGTENLPGWQEKLQRARITAEPPARAPEPAPRDAAETSSAVLPPSGPPSSGAPTTPAPGIGSPSSPLTAGEYDHVAGHGTYARTLVAELETGSLDAAYRVAVVLASTPAHREAAVSLLMRPATARHLLALELLEASMDRFEEAVADHACALGKAAAAEGLFEAAILFFGCAARCGSFTGLVELAAALLIERGEYQTAEDVRIANGGGDGPAPVRPATPRRKNGSPAPKQRRSNGKRSELF